MITMFPHRRAGGPGRLRMLALGLALSVAVVDQASKAMARAHLETALDLTPFLALRLGFNPGVTFGLFAESGATGRWILSLVTGLIITWLLVWIWRMRRPSLAAAAGLVIGGASGNLMDRVRFGHVTDFIDLHWGAAHWPTFNLADAAIVCGVGLLVWASRGGVETRDAFPAIGRAVR